jgi:hypothetical protein
MQKTNKKQKASPRGRPSPQKVHSTQIKKKKRKTKKESNKKLNKHTNNEKSKMEEKEEEDMDTNMIAIPRSIQTEFEAELKNLDADELTLHMDSELLRNTAINSFSGGRPPTERQIQNQMDLLKKREWNALLSSIYNRCLGLTWRDLDGSDPDQEETLTMTHTHTSTSTNNNNNKNNNSKPLKAKNKSKKKNTMKAKA